MAATDSNNSGFKAPIVVVGVVTAALFLYACSLFLQGGFMAAQALEYEAKTYGPADETVAAQRAAQLAILNEKTRWLDKDQGRLCLPIDDAIDRLVVIHATGAARN